MLVSFNPNITSFKQNTNKPQSQINPVTESIYAPVNPPKKQSKFINGISNIAKFFVSLSEMTKATCKGLFFGTLTSVASLGGFWIFGTLPKVLKKESDVTLKEAVKHPLKNMPKTGKVVTALASLGVFTTHIIKGVLTKNQRTANVDHQLKTGHRNI